MLSVCFAFTGPVDSHLDSCFFLLYFSRFTRLNSMSAVMICVRIGETVGSDTACSRSFLGVEEVIAIATGLSGSQGSCKSGCFKAHSESCTASGRTLNELLFYSKTSHRSDAKNRSLLLNEISALFFSLTLQDKSGKCRKNLIQHWNLEKRSVI